MIRKKRLKPLISLSLVSAFLLLTGFAPLNSQAANEAVTKEVYEASTETASENTSENPDTSYEDTGDTGYAEDVTEDSSQVTTEDTSEDITEKAYEDTTEDASEDITEKAYEDTTEDASEESIKDKASPNALIVDPQSSEIFKTYYHDSRFSGYDVLNGIDVSQWNGNINWTQVKKAGYSFVFIRVSGRGATGGGLYTDDRYKTNLEGAIAAGLDVGVYTYTQSITVAEAQQEARFVIDLIKGYNINLPIIYDYEFYPNGRLQNAKLSRATATAICNAFCATIENSGYTAMMYSYKSLLNSNLNPDNITKYYPLWLAIYNDTANYKGDYNYWQYSDSGQVPGINHATDLNYGYMKAPDKVASLTLTPQSDSAISLKWSKVVGCYGYQVFRLDNDTNTYKQVALLRGASTLTYTDNNLLEGTAYTYAVRAIHYLHSGSYYGAFSNKMTSATMGDLQSPGKVKNLHVVSSGSNQVKLMWDMQKGVNAYRVYVKTSPTTTWKVLGDTANNYSNFYIHNKLPSGVSYQYCVRSYKMSGGKVTNAYPYSDKIYAGTGPARVSSLKLTSYTDESISLSWSAVSGANGYMLYYYNYNTNQYDLIKKVGSGTRSYTVPGLLACKGYKFMIQAYKTVNSVDYVSDNTDLNTTTCPSQVSNFKYKLFGRYQFLFWDRQAGATGYKLYIYNTTTNKYTLVTTLEGVNSTTYLGTALTSPYRYHVVAYKTYGKNTYNSRVSYGTSYYSGNLTGTVTASSLNVRRSGDTSAVIIGSLSNGSTVTITGATRTNGVIWYKVSYTKNSSSFVGYCSSQYIKLKQ